MKEIPMDNQADISRDLPIYLSQNTNNGISLWNI